jgi:hypothetical protein
LEVGRQVGKVAGNRQMEFCGGKGRIGDLTAVRWGYAMASPGWRTVPDLGWRLRGRAQVLERSQEALL